MATWDRVAPLVEEIDVRGRRVEVRFRCPASGRTARGYVAIEADTGAKVRALATQSLYYAVRESVFRTVRRMLGWGFVGQFASYFVTAMLPQAPSAHAPLTEEERRRGVLDAFKQVQGQFAWDERNARFVAVDVLHASQSEYERRIDGAPVASEWDAGVLARILGAVARSDGEVSPPEATLFTEHGDLAIGTAREVRVPTDAELRETTPAVRETLLLLAWAMACADHRVRPEEHAEVRRLAGVLGVSEARSTQLLHVARAGVVEALVADASLDDGLDDAERARIEALALELGLSKAEFETIEAATRKRLGRSLPRAEG